jgi:tetratricopeptide (TPR) repeat protein
LLGITAPETTSAFERIHVLSELVPDQTVRALEMAPGWVFHVRGDYDKARALATRKVALAERRGDRQLYVSASNLMGSTLAFQGDLAGGRRWFELSLAAFAEIADEVAQVSFVFDLGVSLHARLAQVLSHLGLVDQARAHRDAALARADALGQPYGRMFALVFAGQLAIRLDEPQRTLEWAESLEQAVTDQPVVEAQGFVRWLRGWALARSGQPESGLVLILEGYAYHLRLGRIGAGCAAILGYAAEALLQMARWNDAQARLDEALALARRLGERIYLPDLHCLEARVALGRGDAGAARASLQAALREARAQQALWLEMTALVALCELDGAAREDFTALAAARASLQEGTGTALVQRADVLLAAVAVESPTRQSTTARRRRGHDPK